VLERRFAVTIKAEIRDEIGSHFSGSFPSVVKQQSDVARQMIDAFGSDGGIAFRLR
jgi:hypothetical protein